MAQPNKYPGVCHACKKPVKAMEGLIEFTHRYRHGRRQNSYQLWCMPCFNRSDNSGPEDRCCGDRAYEDACARVCGF
jgi:hypothetical protein